MPFPSYISISNKFTDKLKSYTDDTNCFSEYFDIVSAIKKSKEIKLFVENNDVSVYVSYSKLDDKVCYRYLYIISQTIGKVKNIDSVMTIISQFENSYVYADKINVECDGGSTYVDIYKLKKD